jgi:hypothetical protein
VQNPCPLGMINQTFHRLANHLLMNNSCCKLSSDYQLAEKLRVARTLCYSEF